ncbi:hypothetical protein CYMTET_43796 [Cymbomonas tetramitiformis]|uniref:Uncharacterized protein n=1 Tax=Cymbomonas tetramitiformis TaxID=36881 RepID=A0AAE0C1G9_9CHLO|nr:hypothetical protein CYMTET_43796 [Cymbomonas tetramitiformis]
MDVLAGMCFCVTAGSVVQGKSILDTILEDTGKMLNQMITEAINKNPDSFSHFLGSMFFGFTIAPVICSYVAITSLMSRSAMTTVGLGVLGAGVKVYCEAPVAAKVFKCARWVFRGTMVINLVQFVVYKVRESKGSKDGFPRDPKGSKDGKAK